MVLYNGLKAKMHALEFFFKTALNSAWRKFPPSCTALLRTSNSEVTLDTIVILTHLTLRVASLSIVVWFGMT